MACSSLTVPEIKDKLASIDKMLCELLGVPDEGTVGRLRISGISGMENRLRREKTRLEGCLAWHLNGGSLPTPRRYV